MTRRDLILKLIIELFVKTGAPVGSKALLESYDLGVSSATIRNEMNALEEEGLLEKTHTSSGRVPSKAGYEYYVTNLRDGGIDEKAKRAIANILDERTKSVQEVIKESCEILSNLTSLASAVLGPKSSQEHLVSVQVIPLSDKTATCVFVTDKGYVENKTFVIDKNIGVENISKAIDMISKRLKGTAIAELPSKMEAMRPILTDYAVGQDAIYQALLGAFISFAKERISLYGKDELLNQPEFANDATKMRQLLSFLDDPSALRKSVEESKNQDGLLLHLGSKEEELEDIAILSAELKLPGENSTALSVVGPKRMDYAKVAALLNYLTRAIEEYFQEDTKAEWEKIKKKN